MGTMFAAAGTVPNHEPPRAVILDVDGTLVDSNDAHTRSWLDVLAEGGQTVPYERVRHMIGMGSDKVLPSLTGVDEDSPAGRHIAARRLEIFKKLYLPYLQPFPGTRALALRMREAGIKLVVASSASSDVLGRLLDIAEVRDLVDNATSTDETAESKPDPDVIRAALRRGGEPPNRVLMIGDTPYDIEAASRACVGTIALRCGGSWSEQDLAGALAVFDDPLDLLINYDDSPLVGRGFWVPVARD